MPLEERDPAYLWDMPDAAIAASAKLAGCTLVTRNTRDPTAVAGMVAVEFWSNEG